MQLDCKVALFVREPACDVCYNPKIEAVRDSDFQPKRKHANATHVYSTVPDKRMPGTLSWLIRNDVIDVEFPSPNSNNPRKTWP